MEQEAAAAEQEEIVKEYKVEQDDPETLQKAREWDDWKDGELSVLDLRSDLSRRVLLSLTIHFIKPNVRPIFHCCELFKKWLVISLK